MNVIVSNKQKGIIDNANIDAIKDLNGLFNVNDLINKFKNYFFSKMILDATSIIDFASKEVLQKLVNEIGADRLVILLPATPEPPLEFKKLLIELKIYNFSNKVEDIVKFIEKPNTYENAMNTIMNTGENADGYYVDNSIKEGQNEDVNQNIDNNIDKEDVNPTNDDIELSNNVTTNHEENSFHTSLGDIMNRINVDNIERSEDNSSSVEEKDNNVSFNQTDGTDYNNNDNHFEMNAINFNGGSGLNNTKSVKKSFLNMDSFDIEEAVNNKPKKIIGIRNVTEHAGSTSLVYMLQLIAKKHSQNVLSIEVNKNDFRLFRCSKMISVKEEDLQNAIDSNKEEIVFIDLNDCKNDSFCNEILYLVEPSIIKLNKLMMENKLIFNELRDKKVILNKSLLNQEDISILEDEAGMKFYFSICPVNDRNDNKVIEELFNNLMAN